MRPSTKYYICETASRSGIARYAEDFYEGVLKEKGYILVSPASISADFLNACPRETRFFVELGSSQYAEKKALLLIQKMRFPRVSVTLHDPPFVNFPFLEVEGRWLNKLSRAVDWYFNTFGMTRAVLEKCETVYVLSRRGRQLLDRRFGGLNVQCIPHIILPDEVYRNPLSGEKNIMSFGFVGKGKGLDYALRFHSLIARRFPNVEMHVVGDAVDASGRLYLESLKQRFKDNVHYHGYVPEERLDELFSGVAHVFLPFNEYKYICPTSGSVVNALRRGRIVWTNPVNSVPELVQDGTNGVFFRKSHEQNLRVFEQFMENPRLVAELSQRILKGVADQSDARLYGCVA